MVNPFWKALLYCRTVDGYLTNYYGYWAKKRVMSPAAEILAQNCIPRLSIMNVPSVRVYVC